MSRARPFAIPAVVFALACATGSVPPLEASPPPRTELRTFSYRCGTSTAVVALDDENGAHLFTSEGSYPLERVRTASGARYAMGAVDVWMRGNEARIEIDGQAEVCREDRPRSIVEDAKLRGVSFRAVGNEPGWVMEIGPSWIWIEVDYGNAQHWFPLQRPDVDLAQRRSVYHSARDGHTLEITLKGDPCTDTMADQEFETSVTLRLDDRSFRGCGAALY